jgi:hypothetical protein
MKAFKATNGWGGKFKSEAEFLNAVLERKKNLRGTSRKFYDELETAARRRWACRRRRSRA